MGRSFFDTLLLSGDSTRTTHLNKFRFIWNLTVSVSGALSARVIHSDFNNRRVAVCTALNDVTSRGITVETIDV
jgi:hypothetical protein